MISRTFLAFAVVVSFHVCSALVAFPQTLDPSCGPLSGGTVVTIHGIFNSSCTFTVTIGNVTLTSLNVSMAGLLFTTPARSSEDVLAVQVSSPCGPFLSPALSFHYYVVPHVTAVSPPSIPLFGGIILTIFTGGLAFSQHVSVKLENATFGSVVTAATVHADGRVTCDTKELGGWETLPSVTMAILVAPNGQNYFDTGFTVSMVPGSPLRMGFLFPGPIADLGWTYAHNIGRLAVGTVLGAALVTDYIEHVGNSKGPSAEEGVATLLARNCTLIVGTSFDHQEAIYAAAAAHPDLYFVQVSGQLTRANMVQVFAKLYQARFLAGSLSAHFTDSLGFLAPFPIPEVIRNINAFAIGARRVNPAATVRVLWPGQWYNPRLEEWGARKLLARKVEVITQDSDSQAGQRLFNRAGKMSIGKNSDVRALIGESVLTSARFQWAPLYELLVRRVLGGTWVPDDDIFEGFDLGAVGLTECSALVPDTVKKTIAAMEADLREGVDTIFCGPLNDINGDLKVEAGRCLTKEEVLSMDWLVEGVVDDGAYALPECDYGQTINGTEESCLFCPAGFTSLSVNAEECVPCPAGSFRPCDDCVDEDGGCTPCPIGSYATAEGNMECTPCPGESVTLEAGALNADACFCPDHMCGASVADCHACEEGVNGAAIAAAVLSGGAFVLGIASILLWWRTQQARNHRSYYLDGGDVELLDRIGCGTFADVYVGKLSGSTVAVKILRTRKRVERRADRGDGTTNVVTSADCLVPLASSAELDDSRRSAGTLVAGSSGTSITNQPSHRNQKGHSTGSSTARSRAKWSSRLKVFRHEVDMISGMRHPNVVLFMGAVVAPFMAIITEFAEQGSLFDVLHNVTMSFSEKRKAGMALGAARGLHYLHTHKPTVIHCDVKSLNFLVDSQFNVKIADFGISKAISNAGKGHGTLAWAAPELLRRQPNSIFSDVYAFGVVLWEIETRKEPYGDCPRDVIAAKIKAGETLKLPPTTSSRIAGLCRMCWQKIPEQRVTMTETLAALQISYDAIQEEATSGKVVGEDLVRVVYTEEETAAILAGKPAPSKQCEGVAMLFSGIVGFSELSAQLSGDEVAALLKELSEKFDLRCKQWGVRKVDTVGDMLIAIAGLGGGDAAHNARAAVGLALDMAADARTTATRVGAIDVRIGVHTGNVAAIVAGTTSRKLTFVGDAVNTASRMESHGLPGLVHISAETWALVQPSVKGYKRGDVKIKGKGLLTTYVATGMREDGLVSDQEDRSEDL